MKASLSFSAADWDFDTVWGIEEGVTYPYLKTIPLDVKVSSADLAAGTASGATTSYHQLTETVVATPSPGYRFSHWTDYGETVSTDATYTFQMQTHRDLVAHFLPGHTLTYTAGAGGSLSGELTQGVDPGADGSPVQAIPEPGARFLRWSDGSTDNPRADLAVAASLEVTALFESAGGVAIGWYEEHGIFPAEGQVWSDLDTLDSDGDGQDNASEHLALTDPRNPGSRFGASVESGDGGMAIRVAPVSADRRYSLSHSPDLSPGSWQPVTGMQMLAVDPADPVLPIGPPTGTQGFYRVEVSKP